MGPQGPPVAHLSAIDITGDLFTLGTPPLPGLTSDGVETGTDSAKREVRILLECILVSFIFI